MTRLKIHSDGTVHFPAKVLRQANLQPGARVAVSTRAGQLSLSADGGNLAKAYAAYYRGAPASMIGEQLEIERDFAAADAELIELYYQTSGALEGRNAFVEKRKPDFRAALNGQVSARGRASDEASRRRWLE